MTNDFGIINRVFIITRDNALNNIVMLIEFEIRACISVISI
jgi:hypothetical protein